MQTNDNPQWPTKPMIAWGTLGGPAARRYHRRCALALTAMVVCLIGGALLHLKPVAAFGPGLAFAYIAWEFRRYLAELDELARRIQLESVAWTYLTGLVLSMIVGPAGLMYDFHVNATWFMVLEPVRTCWLIFVARRYQ